MIKYSLSCDTGHEFEAWFRDSATYKCQKSTGEVACPVCGSSIVEKALMTPGLGAASVGKSDAKNNQQVFKTDSNEDKVKTIIRQLYKHVEENSDYVGNKFAEEARRIHYNEAEARGIYGEVTADEVYSLDEEGIEIMPLPKLPEDHN